MPVAESFFWRPCNLISLNIWSVICEARQEIKFLLQRTTMESFYLSAIVIFTVIFTVGFLLLKKNKGKNGCALLLPGNLGQPLVGETIRFLRAFKSNQIDEFLRERVIAHGPVFKTCLFGQPTVVMTGPAGNRFWLVNDGKLFHGNARGPHRAIIGQNSLLDKNGDDHRLVRAALMTFFSPSSIKKLVGKMDFAIRRHVEEYWSGKERVYAVHLMKSMAFSVTCDVLFNVQDKCQVEELCELFKVATDGIYSFPVRFPGSRLDRALKARSRIDRILSAMIAQRRKDMEAGGDSGRKDLISTLLSLIDKDQKPLGDQELKDNIVLVVIAGHETTAMTLALMCKLLAANPLCFDQIAKEAEDIGVGEQLTWEDVQRMKYLWSVAQETLRLIPPISGIFRKATTDIQYGKYTIPKGWTMYWSNYSTVYREDLFREPHKFDPSRFQSLGGITPYSFLPFGGGLRMCPGNEYAKMEILITMHHLIKRFRWSAQIPDEPIVRNPLCLPAMGLPLILTPLKNK